MTYLRLAALVAPLAACVVDNPRFIPDPGDADSSANTTTGTPGTGSTPGSSGETGTVDTGTTEPVLTGEPPTTTASTLPSDTSTTDATTTVDTTVDTAEVSSSDGTDDSSGTTGGCANTAMVNMKPVADAFFIAGGSDNQSTCKYYDLLADGASACKDLNFGTTAALRLARMEGGIDAMFAVKFSYEAIAALVGQGVTIDHAELAIIVYDQIPQPIELQVGMITQSWTAGLKNGKLALMGDSSFESADIGFQAAPWNGGDGPRGASVPVASLGVPVGFKLHEELVSTPFSVEPWIDNQDQAHGLVLSFAKNVAVPTYGPGIKAMESPGFEPILRLHYCKP